MPGMERWEAHCILVHVSDDGDGEVLEFGASLWLYIITWWLKFPCPVSGYPVFCNMENPRAYEWSSMASIHDQLYEKYSIVYRSQIQVWVMCQKTPPGMLNFRLFLNLKIFTDGLWATFTALVQCFLFFWLEVGTILYLYLFVWEECGKFACFQISSAS